MKKRSKFFLFILLALLMLAIPLFIIIRNESHLSDTAFQYKFRQIYPKDPFDPIRGKYITLRFFQRSVPLKENESIKKGEQAYVIVERDSSGWAFFKSVQKSIPDVPNYFQTSVSYSDANSAVVDIPFDRYYMNEEIAPLAEEKYWQLSFGRDTNLYIVVTIKNGTALTNELYYGDLTFKEYLNKQENR